MRCACDGTASAHDRPVRGHMCACVCVCVRLLEMAVPVQSLHGAAIPQRHMRGHTLIAGLWDWQREGVQRC